MSNLGLLCGRRRVAAGGAPWDPTVPGTPVLWLDATAALAGGRLWTTSGKTVNVASPGDPIGAWVQEGGLTPDFIQATSSRRFSLGTIGSKSAAASDGIDDGLASATFVLSAGAKTFAGRFQYSTTLGSTEIDTLFLLGQVGSAQTIVQIRGTGSTYPGLSVICDLAGVSKVSTRAPSVAPGTTAFTVVVVYNGGAIDSAASYRIWIDGVEQGSLTTSAAFSGTGSTSYLLCTTIAGSPVTGATSAILVWTGDQAAHVANIHAWLTT